MKIKNTSTGNEEVILEALESLKIFLKNSNNKDEKNHFKLLIEILKNKETRTNYVTIKSIAVIYNLINELGFESFGKNDTKKLVLDMNNSFLEEDLEIHDDLDAKIIDLMFDNKNFSIEKECVYLFEDKIGDLLQIIEINNNGKKSLNIDDIKNTLKKKLKKEIKILKGNLKNSEIFKTIERTKKNVDKRL